MYKQGNQIGGGLRAWRSSASPGALHTAGTRCPSTINLRSREGTGRRAAPRADYKNYNYLYISGMGRLVAAILRERLSQVIQMIRQIYGRADLPTDEISAGGGGDASDVLQDARLLC
ncbi:hypothetical protein EVAR_39427_1 [Eumeta japonica]|uniref:Uncharacterized protein n=1 Tax=Eumeta variegata TaxID=151549 RepID=A0A4C1W0N6_EUMVA|nr:hypothetical protein EVAR_39427_1 [Eumeta japonica]